MLSYENNLKMGVLDRVLFSVAVTKLLILAQFGSGFNTLVLVILAIIGKGNFIDMAIYTMVHMMDDPGAVASVTIASLLLLKLIQWKVGFAWQGEAQASFIYSQAAGFARASNAGVSRGTAMGRPVHVHFYPSNSPGNYRCLGVGTLSEIGGRDSSVDRHGTGHSAEHAWERINERVEESARERRLVFFQIDT